VGTGCHRYLWVKQQLRVTDRDDRSKNWDLLGAQRVFNNSRHQSGLVVVVIMSLRRDAKL
jgi:hypothetical protein